MLFVFNDSSGMFLFGMGQRCLQASSGFCSKCQILLACPRGISGVCVCVCSICLDECLVCFACLCNVGLLGLVWLAAVCNLCSACVWDCDGWCWAFCGCVWSWSVFEKCLGYVWFRFDFVLRMFAAGWKSVWIFFASVKKVWVVFACSVSSGWNSVGLCVACV